VFRLKIVCLGLSALMATTCLTTNEAVAETPSAISVAPHPAPVPPPLVTSGPAVSKVGGTGGIARTTYCKFLTRYDDVHYSSTDGDVSGHGWWTNVDCPKGTKAKVKVYLQEYYSDGKLRTKNVGSKTVYAGGGSANRAVARHTCQGKAVAGWRTQIDVDLVNISDTDNIGQSGVENLKCVVN
jgi:hypothetical protein